MSRKTKIRPTLSKLLKRISTNILRIREKKGWTQEEVAERGNIDLRWYQRLESGRYSFNLETLARLAELFKVDVSEFFH